MIFVNFVVKKLLLFSRVLKNKNQAVRQGARRCDKRSIYQAYVSIGESRATLHGGLRRSFFKSLLKNLNHEAHEGHEEKGNEVFIFVRIHGVGRQF